MPTSQFRQGQASPSQRRHFRHPRRDSQLRIASAIYVNDIRARRSVRAADQLKRMLNDFRSSCHKRRLYTINRRDLVAYIAVLRERRLADRTIFNRTSTVLSFLRSFDVEGLLSRRDLPRYTQKCVDAYSEADVAELHVPATKRSRRSLDFSSPQAVANRK